MYVYFFVMEKFNSSINLLWSIEKLLMAKFQCFQCFIYLNMGNLNFSVWTYLTLECFQIFFEIRMGLTNEIQD